MYVGSSFRENDFESEVLSSNSLKLMRKLSREDKLIGVLLIVLDVLVCWELIALAPGCLPAAHDRESGFDLKSDLVKGTVGVALRDVANGVDVVEVISIHREGALKACNGVLVSVLLVVNSAKFACELCDLVLALVKLINMDGLPMRDSDCSGHIFEERKRAVVSEVDENWKGGKWFY